MSTTYDVTFTVVVPEGRDFVLDPYPFDNLFEDQGAEVVNVSVAVEEGK